MRAIKWVAAVGMLAALGIGLWVFFVFQTLPSPELLSDREVAESTKIYDRTGEVLLYEIHGEEKRTVVPLEEIPDAVRQATIALEDANFYRHAAVDLRGIVRALLVNLRRGGVRQGGSTITQQLAKNAFLTPERTLSRKVRELLLAIELERRLTKDEILHRYLNQIPYGANAYGVEAASRVYFGTSARDLSLAESALLASLPKAPSYYSPWGSHADELLARKDRVLNAMAAQGFITPASRDAAKSETLTFREPATEIQAPHFVIAVVEYLNDRYGEDFVRGAGLTVRTTLDWELQRLAERVVAEGAARNEELYKGTNAALVAEEAGTGHILAMVGSRNYFDIEREGNFNVATQGLRQPGSAIKPLVYATAFERGYTPETVLFDLETEFDTTGKLEKSYKPQNFDERFRGPITLRESLAQSVNVTSVKTLYLAGIDAVLENARRFGITTLTDRYRYGLSLVLGGGEVTLAELVGAYATLAAEGTRRPQVLVTKVTTPEGIVLEESRDRPEEVMDPQYPRLVSDILSDVEARAPLFAASLAKTVFPGHQVALKTGTTNDYRDAWAIGYTRSLAVGVWAGNNNNEPMQRRGGSILAAVPIWSEFMREALKGKPLEPFTRPNPSPAPKPVLAGAPLTTFEASGVRYPQAHEILFYVNPKDPLGPMPEHPESESQFENWEGPVLAWASSTIPNWAAYNRPLPRGSVAVDERFPAASAAPVVEVREPQNGTFVGATIPLVARLSAPGGIERVEVYLNGTLVATGAPAGTSTEYRVSIPAQGLPLQSALRVVLRDRENRAAEAQLVLFR